MTKLYFWSVLALFAPLLASAVQAENAHDLDAEAGTLTLTLKDGQKWEADKHTADSVAALKGVLDRFEKKAEDAAAGDFRKLGGQLEEELHALIRDCTMQGPDHDQLHVWIALLAPKLQDLKGAERVADARDSVEAISLLLEEFDKHFKRNAPSRREE